MSPQLSNLVDVLFSELAKINNTELTDEQLDKQLRRTESITKVSSQIIAAARLGLDAQKALPDMLDGARVPTMLRIDKQ